jgi:hypothetical protein
MPLDDPYAAQRVSVDRCGEGAAGGPRQARAPAHAVLRLVTCRVLHSCSNGGARG